MRKPNWPEILFEELAKMAKREFIRGECDCCLFAADIVLAMTGEDYAAAYRGKYKTKKGAASALRKYGGGTIETSIPLDEIPVNYAGRGDLVLADLPNGPAVGICIGAIAAFKAAGKGLAYIPITECRMAWKV